MNSWRTHAAPRLHINAIPARVDAADGAIPKIDLKVPEKLMIDHHRIHGPVQAMWRRRFTAARAYIVNWVKAAPSARAKAMVTRGLA